jgi:hypothetical protein
MTIVATSERQKMLNAGMLSFGRSEMGAGSHKQQFGIMI